MTSETSRISAKVLGPGSSEPGTSTEVDELLTFVPELAFLPEFDACVPSVDDHATHEEVDAHFDYETIEPVVGALKTLAEQAAADSNGGLAFLVRTMLHFLQVQKVPPSQHPLLVALYLRGSARATASSETARAIASVMDRWG